MKKLFIILVLSFLVLYNNVYVATATCISGECEVMYSSHYKWALIDCYEPLLMEEVETDSSSLKIVATGKTCTVFNSK